MTKIKSAILTALVVGSSFAASSAFAGHYEIYNGSAWVTSGTATLSGATTASPVGIPVPCSSAVFTLTIPGSGGNPASVTNATFGTSTACTSISKVLPWAVSAPNASGIVTISGISITFTSPAATCMGSVSGPLSPISQDPPLPRVNNTYSFSGTLGVCTNVRSTTALTSNVPIRWVP